MTKYSLLLARHLLAFHKKVQELSMTSTTAVSDSNLFEIETSVDGRYSLAGHGCTRTHISPHGWCGHEPRARLTPLPSSSTLGGEAGCLGKCGGWGIIYEHEETCLNLRVQF